MEGPDKARRRHTKSRKGCIPCKRRHERCDEFVPQCRNCSKRGAKCEYPESVRPKESALDLPWISSASATEASDKLEDATLAQQLSPYDFSSTDYRLMHHVLFVSGKLEASGSSKMAVIDAMRTWANESVFSAILMQHLKEDAGVEDPNPPGPNDDDQARLDFCIRSLKEAEDFMTQATEHAAMHKCLLSFTENLRTLPPGPKMSEQYRILYPLRGWLFWMPKSFLDMDKKDLHTLISFAYFNATTLAVKPFFPKARDVFFRQTQASAAKSILLYLKMRYSQEGDKFGPERQKLRQALTLAEYAAKIVGEL
ncbi:hypothetical protein EG329_000656 [Mollisiaceae sp. DMI_Dod_QoI]|nr:hypothetical protein EG329_000656 [Helotiales sp. DMI_Dod_QoI]